MSVIPDRVKKNQTLWWDRKGLSVCLVGWKGGDKEYPKPADLNTYWFDPNFRVGYWKHLIDNSVCFCEAFNYYDTYTGPGNMNLYLGCEPGLSEETVWYKPCITDPDSHGPIRFSARNKWYQAHMRIADAMLKAAGGKYAVSLPDMVENIDVLAAMRDTQVLMMDLIERPAWVEKSLEEINQAYFECFDLYYSRLQADGGNMFSSFRLWGPGKTAKLQADLIVMISREMFKRFVVPPLQRQCQWLDYSMYHLDGDDALQHMDALLAIDELDAIEWTPIGCSGKVLGKPMSGNPYYYPLYKQIKKAGKAVQAVAIKPQEVIPLLDAVGPEGMMVMVDWTDVDTAEKLAAKLESYYPKG